MGGFHQSMICSNDDMIGPDSVLDYVKHTGRMNVLGILHVATLWLENDEEIFLEFVCKKRWRFLESTKHISVNCK
jgi:hypothetical protein